jgi:hypothetical protein
MALLGALEHGIYVEKEDDSDDECHGLSIAQIHQYFGLDKDGSETSDDEMLVEEEEQCQAEDVGDVGDEDSMSNDEDWLASPSGSEDEEMEELDASDPDVVCFIIISWVYESEYQTILGPFCGAV